MFNWKIPVYHLSWKQKLTMVIAVTLLGLVIVAGSAFMSLNIVNSSITKQNTVAEYKQHSLALAIALLTIESLADTVGNDSASDFLKHLDALSQMVKAMKVEASLLNYKEIDLMSNQIDNLIDDYIGQRKGWLQNRLTLGFTPDEGKLSEIYTRLAALEKITLSIVSKHIDALSSNHNKYILTGFKNNLEGTEKAITELEKISVNLQWEENVIGQSIKGYRDDFEKIKVLADKEIKAFDIMLPLIAELNQLVEQQNVFLEETSQRVTRETNASRVAAIRFIMGAALVVSLITLISLSRVASQLNKQLKQMRQFLAKIAEGDFSEKLPTGDNTKDEFNQLRLASNQMINDISAVLSQVVEGSSTLLEIEEQLESAVLQLSHTSEKVEKKAQQATIATQQISSAVSDVAERANEVSSVACQASNTTHMGEQTVDACVNSMRSLSNKIEESNKEVTDLVDSGSKMLGIIDAINGLADQTNLLALNAAIEAARAGEAGRGFSVVADEVRALAQKTVTATGNIEEIIRHFSSQSKRMGSLMEEGMVLAASSQEEAENALNAFESINSATRQVSTEMGQVVSAVDEISNNSTDISHQIVHISDGYEETKRIRHVLADHADNLSKQSRSLEGLTHRFKLPV